MEVYLSYHTDIWHGNPRLIGVASSPEMAIEIAKEDKDAVADVKNNDGHVTVDEVAVDEKDSEHRIFDTELDEAWEQLTGEERYKDED